MTPRVKTYYLLSQQGDKIAAQNFDVDRGELVGFPEYLDRAGTVSVSDTGMLVIRTDNEGNITTVVAGSQRA